MGIDFSNKTCEVCGSKLSKDNRCNSCEAMEGLWK